MCHARQCCSGADRQLACHRCIGCRRQNRQQKHLQAKTHTNRGKAHAQNDETCTPTRQPHGQIAQCGTYARTCFIESDAYEACVQTDDIADTGVAQQLLGSRRLPIEQRPSVWATNRLAAGPSPQPYDDTVASSAVKLGSDEGDVQAVTAQQQR